MACFFCDLLPQRILRKSEGCIALADGYPVCRGHALLIRERNVGSFFETSAENRAALFRLLEGCRSDLSARYAPAGFNVGISCGAMAGQTVMHLHIHPIPRYAGDKPDPRGGVRWIFPEKADYWSGR